MDLSDQALTSLRQTLPIYSYTLRDLSQISEWTDRFFAAASVEALLRTG